MRFEVLTPNLLELDSTSGDLLAIPLFSERLPPRGIGGELDWRLHGQISRLIASGFRLPSNQDLSPLAGAFDAGEGSRILLPGGPRVPYQWLMFFGLGQRSEYTTEKYKKIVAGLVEAVMGLKIRSLAVVLPEWRRAMVTTKASVETLLAELWNQRAGLKEPLDRLVVIESIDAHSELLETAAAFLSRRGSGS